MKVASALGAIVCFTAVTALAQRSVSVEFEGCESTLRSDARQFLALELKGDEHDVDLIARARCSGDSQVTLTIEEHLAVRATRVIELERTDLRDRGRLIALALVELVRSTRQTTAAPPSLEKATGPKPVEPTKTIEVAALGGALSFFSPRNVAWGGALSVSGDTGSVAGFSVQIGVHAANKLTELGRVALTNYSAMGLLTGRLAFGAVVLRGGFGARLGVASLAGMANGVEVQANSAVRGWGGPAIGLTCQVQLTRHLGLVANVEGGYALWAVRGLVDQISTMSLDGPWLGLHAGVVGVW